MVALARQLIDRQSTTYNPADIEDRYETRLRGMIDAKLKGEGIEEEEAVEPDRANVVDLMAALKKSLGQGTDAPANGGRVPKAKAGPSVKSGKKQSPKVPHPKPARKRA